MKRFGFLMLAVFVGGLILSSCQTVDNPKQMGNRERLDRFHRQKQVY